MFKRLVLFEPKAGLDLEAVWQFWVDDFGPRHVGPGHIRFSVSRVIQTDIGTGKLWGIAASWFDSEEAFRSSQARHQDDAQFKKLIEEWHNYWAVRSYLLLEEKRLFERPDWVSLQNGVKRASFFVPKEGIDLAATWQYWVTDFGPRHVGPGSELIMTCINRTTSPPERGGIWGLAESYFNSISATRDFGARHHNDPDMKMRMDRWNSQWAVHTSYVMEEKVLFQR